METATVPVRFEGTDEERAANYATHNFVSYGSEVECTRCVCKPWHVAASYPCGVEPPRAEVPAEAALAEQTARFTAFATAVEGR